MNDEETPVVDITEKKPKLKLFFSLLSGDIYQIESDEVKNLDDYQIPLLQRPNTSCKKCYGRLYHMYNTTTKIYQPCPRCARKCFDFKSMKTEIKIETPNG